jgi:hypothetical protein
MILLPLCYQDGCTPLIRAAQAGHLEVLAVLLSAGADPNFKDHVRWHYGLVSRLFTDNI